MGSELLKGFYLRDLLVMPRKGQVSGRSGLVHLPPNAMQVLVCLASHAGELITREMLIESVWGEERDGQEALKHAITEIRQALDDQAAESRFVESVPERGYRLIVTPVLQSETRSSAVPGGEKGRKEDDIGLFENLRQRGVLETVIAYLVLGWLLIQVGDIVFEQLGFPDWAATFVTVLVISGFPIAIALSWFLEFRHGRAVLHELTPRDAQRRRFGRTYLSVIGALAIAAVLVFVYDRNIGLPGAREKTSETAAAVSGLPVIQQNTIAVLPFVNVDGSDETRVFANGLADDVITRLSRVPGLLVSSRGDSFTLEPNTSSQKVRERLRVARYLEGSVQVSESMIRVIVKLIDSKNGFHIFSDRFDRSKEDFFDIRDEITERTVSNIRVTLPPETQAASIISPDEPSLNAYVLYRRGVDLLHRTRTIYSMQAALKWFDAALDVDPDYAAAHAGKCAAFVYAYQEVYDPAYINRAKTACTNALALNPNLDVVHTALGDLYFETGQYGEAQIAYKQALDIVPNSVAALTGLGDTYVRQQNPEAAEASYRQAVGLHPGDWSAYNGLGAFFYRTGRYDNAIKEFQRVVDLDPNNSTGYLNLGSSHMLAGNFESAVPALEKSIELEPHADTYSNLGLLHYYLGNLEQAVESHRHAIELAPNDYLKWSNLGDTLWISAKPDEARQAFETAEELAGGALKVNPNDPNIQMDLAWISAMLGKTGLARTYIDRAMNGAPDDPYVHYIDGLILLRNGDSESALAALETAADKGYSLQMMAAEPHLASIQENPRFRAIVDRI